MNDLTIIYLTANEISDAFGANMRYHLLEASHGAKIINVSKKPGSFGDRNIVFYTPRSHFNIYREALAGAKSAETKYIAIVEDDVLYSPEHFKHRPKPGHFAYNVACWALITWMKPLFACGAFGARKNFGQLICERELFIEAMEERFKKWPDDSQTPKDYWAEPGKYEKFLQVTERKTQTFYTDPANIMFTHAEGLSYHTIGTKKRMPEMRATEIPFWGRAEEVIKYYETT